MDRRLLMPGIDNAEIPIRHNIERRQNVITSQSKNILHPFKLEGLAD
jgi:hypothetical protein